MEYWQSVKFHSSPPLTCHGERQNLWCQVPCVHHFTPNYRAHNLLKVCITQVLRMLGCNHRGVRTQRCMTVQYPRDDMTRTIDAYFSFFRYNSPLWESYIRRYQTFFQAQNGPVEWHRTRGETRGKYGYNCPDQQSSKLSNFPQFSPIIIKIPIEWICRVRVSVNHRVDSPYIRSWIFVWW